MRLTTILVRPARPANVGAAARALKNFGHSELRLVGGGRCLAGGEGSAEARALAWNAADVLDAARDFATLGAAVADLAFVAAATARAEPGRDALTPREFAAEAARLPPGSAAGCVFGPKNHKLSDAEMDRCRARLRIPTAEGQPSLNLAQAVVVVAYEAGLASLAAAPGEPAGDDVPALEGDLERLFTTGGDLLLRAGYLNAQAPGHVLGELRRLLARARPSRREVLLLLALARQLDWARGGAGAADSGDGQGGG